jgi:hypothetical protein
LIALASRLFRYYISIFSKVFVYTLTSLVHRFLIYISQSLCHKLSIAQYVIEFLLRYIYFGPTFKLFNPFFGFFELHQLSSPKALANHGSLFDLLAELFCQAFFI